MSRLSGEPVRPMGASHSTADPGSIADPTESRHRSLPEDLDTLGPHRQQARPAPEASLGVADDIAWLYRYDASGSGVASGDNWTLLLPLDSHPSHPSGYQQVPAPPLPAPPQSRNPVIIMIVLLLCVTAGAVTGLALVLRSDWRIAAPSSGTSSVEQAAPSDAQQVTSFTPTQVNAGCQAPQSTDGAGDVVVYTPEQMSDGKMNTAWRCNGNGVGQVVTFGFPAGTTIAQVGLVNGYAKVDPASGVQRYGEYRRITAVTWTFANGTAFQQSLNDGVETVQKLSIPAQSGDQVTLTIEATTEPGSTAPARDAVLISEVVFGSPG
jgi:hypothetical protein